MSTLHELPGLDPTRLSTYLASIGLAKVVAKQVDPGVALGWSGNRFQLRTSGDLDLAEFLVHDYRPTPVVSPWNGGSGFQPQDKKQAIVVDQIASAEGTRLESFRETIAAARAVLTGERGYLRWEAAGKVSKGGLVQALRNELPDAALDWLDAAVVLRLDLDDPKYPILLGTGGNDGRLEVSSNFHQRLLQVLPELDGRNDQSMGWARDLLDGTSTTPAAKASVGMYDPVGAGGPESSSTGAADSRVNPWGYILMVEGLTAFASGAARRFGSTRARAAMPFMVDGGAGAGIPGAPNEKVRGEFWAPLTASTPWRSFEHIVREARASWDGNYATSAVHMYGAARTFGVDRGIQAFNRFVFAELNGLAYSAVLRDHVRVERDSGAGLLAPILRHSETLTRAGTSRTVRLQRAFDAAASRHLSAPTVPRLIEALASLTRLELAATSSDRGRKSISMSRPNRADAREVLAWLGAQREGVPAEVLVAASIASAFALRSDGNGTVPVRQLVAWTHANKSWRPPQVTGLGTRPTVEVLADLGVWLSHHQPVDRGRIARGFVPLLHHRVRPQAEHVHAWALGLLDDRLVDEAFLAMLALDWRDAKDVRQPGARPAPTVVSPPLAILRTFTSQRVVLPGQPPTKDALRRGLETSWMTQLRAGQVSRTADAARAQLRRHKVLTRGAATSEPRRFSLRSVHLSPLPTADVTDARLGSRLAAALLVGAGWRDLSLVAEVGEELALATVHEEDSPS